MEESHNTENTGSHQSQQSPNVLVHVEELWSEAKTTMSKLLIERYQK